MTRPSQASIEAWRPALLVVRATRCDRQVGPEGIDGVMLVPSRSVVDAHHEVRLEGGAAVTCTCWPARRGKPCIHRAAAAVRRWSQETALDFGAVPLRAVLPLLVERYLEAPPARRGTGPGTAQDDPPERRLAG